MFFLVFLLVVALVSPRPFLRNDESNADNAGLDAKTARTHERASVCSRATHIKERSKGRLACEGTAVLNPGSAFVASFNGVA